MTDSDPLSELASASRVVEVRTAARLERLRAGLEARERALARNVTRRRILVGLALLIAATLAISFVLKVHPVAYVTADIDQWLAENEARGRLSRALARLPDGLFSDTGREPTLAEVLRMLDALNEGGEPGWVQTLAGGAKCPIETLSCARDESAMSAGAPREGLLRLAKTAVSVLAVQSNCQDAANLIAEYDDVHGWRASELPGKAWMESNVASCFRREDGSVAAAEHYRLSLCASSHFDPGFLAAQGLAHLSFEQANTADAHSWLSCAEDMLRLELSRSGASKEVLAYLIDLSATILTWFEDLPVFETIHNEVERHLDELLRTTTGAERAELFQLQAGVYADALEVYVTKGDHERVQTTYTRLVEQPYVPTYLAVIVRALFVAHLLKQGEHEAAHRVTLDMERRYRELPEFAEYWDWRLFVAWLDKGGDGAQREIDEMIKVLVSVLDGPKSATKSRELKTFVQWVGRLKG